MRLEPAAAFFERRNWLLEYANHAGDLVDL
jgi:hypothetical protein